jgi:hypothetical protein
VNDNIRKDEFVKMHILGKTKAEYDREDIEGFFRSYHAVVPKESLGKLLRRELEEIQELKGRVEELEGMLLLGKGQAEMDTTECGDK